MVKKITPSFTLPFARKCFRYWKVFRDRNQIRDILKYYTQHESTDEIGHILQSLPRYGICPFPYEWANMDAASLVDAYYDSDKDLSYVHLDGKRLYYPRDMDKEEIQSNYYFVQMIE